MGESRSMLPWLRAAAVTGCAALLCSSGLLSAPAFADDSTSSFTLDPPYAQTGQTVTLTAEGTMTFPTDGSAAVTFNQNVPATSVDSVSPTQLSVVVPDGATTGPVDVVASDTTYAGPTFTLQQPTSWTASLTPAVITYGHKAMVSAALSTAGMVSGPVAGAAATLQHRSSPTGAWHTPATGAHKSTAANGRVRWIVAPTRNGQYRVVFGQTPAYGGSTSTPLGLSVRPLIKVHKIATAPAGTPTHITGQITPKNVGPVSLQRRTGRTWRGIATATPRHGRFSFTVSPEAYSVAHYRIVRRADASHSQGISRALNIEVVNRILRYGASGPDVRTLQARLRALHYDVGPKSSFYRWDMVHAVTAFQKVQGLTRDGVAYNKVWRGLAHPRKVHLRHANSGRTEVEVNLTKEILVIAKNGKVWRILDTSTGGGYSYTGSDGSPSVAITPTGHFTIQYKQTGWQKSKLGELYYPSYFTNTGFAIHGEGDTNSGSNVPPYPASHGCVRVSNSAVLRYYYKVFTVGTPVWIYR
ncbi:MAG TPA: L,D-transpeptidase family protein [Mycobacteriales bacterium]|nr:L,D-transpeptidase family protein [Mycobacteriales bacterium]